MSRLSDAWEAWLDSSGEGEREAAIREELESALTERLVELAEEIDE